jgi:substrate import-associated zinc metallohydrolase lipoprotein
MKINNILILLFSVIVLGSCSKDSLSSDSIFNTTEPQRNEFDTWLLKNYVDTYNIRFNYLYQDKEVDNYYNLVPAKIENSIALAIMMRHVWIDAYTEVAGADFMKTYCPRVMQLVGSAAYNGNGSMVMGTAEGGLKVTLYNVNIIDINNPSIDVESPFTNNSASSKDLNYWFFHTMHHEFCHILTQKKNYSTDFRTVSVANYRSTDWINLADTKAPALGFVSGYASSEYNEDFAEIYSTYITHSEASWQKILAAGVVTTKDDDGNVISTDTSGKDAILAKLTILKDYLKNSWGIDIDTLRDVVLRRSNEVKTLDLKNLK